jgi:hypothetical protein
VAVVTLFVAFVARDMIIEDHSLIHSAISIGITIFSLYLLNLDIQSFHQQQVEDGESPFSFSLQADIYSIIFILLYTHRLLVATGNIYLEGPIWKILQTILILGFYIYRLLTEADPDKLD